MTKTFTESMLGWAVTPKAKTATVKVVPVRIVTSTASSSPGMLQASCCALSIAPAVNSELKPQASLTILRVTLLPLKKKIMHLATLGFSCGIWNL